MDRWYAATRPIQYKQKQMTRAQSQIVMLFIFCVVICLPSFYFPSIDTSVAIERQECQLAVHLSSALTLLDIIFFSLVPFVFTLLFSVMTLVALVRNAQKETKNTFGIMKANTETG